MAVVGMRIHTAAVQQWHIWWRFWLPGEVRMVPPVRIVCIVVWGSGWWLVLAHSIGLFSHQIPY